MKVRVDVNCDPIHEKLDMDLLILLYLYIMWSLLIGCAVAEMNRSIMGWIFISLIASPIMAVLLLIALGPVAPGTED